MLGGRSAKQTAKHRNGTGAEARNELLSRISEGAGCLGVCLSVCGLNSRWEYARLSLAWYGTRTLLHSEHVVIRLMSEFEGARIVRLMRTRDPFLGSFELYSLWQDMSAIFGNAFLFLCGLSERKYILLLRRVHTGDKRQSQERLATCDKRPPIVKLRAIGESLPQAASGKLSGGAFD